MLSHVLLCASYSLPASYDHEIFPGRIRSGLPFPSPGERPNSWIKPKSPVLQADSEPLLLLLLLLSRFSHAQLLATTWTGAYQAPLSMGSSRQEYWSGVPLPSPLSLEGSPYILYTYMGHGEGNGNPLQYSCLENPMDRGVWGL